MEKFQNFDPELEVFDQTDHLIVFFEDDFGIFGLEGGVLDQGKLITWVLNFTVIF